MGKNIFFGVDIGATKTVFILAEFPKKGFKILNIAKYLTPKKEKEIIGMIAENFLRAGSSWKISAIGIGFAGPVDFKKGAALIGPNLKTGRIEFKKNLEKKLKVPIATDNDAKCFVLAENIFGAAKGHKNIVGLAVGTGIGSGIIIDGKIYRGAAGSAGELGHTNIEKTRELEKTASGRGLENIYWKITGRKMDSRKIVALAKSKNKNALKAVERTAENLGIGIANIIEVFNPEIVVLGGGLAEADLIVNKAKKYAKKKIFLPSLLKTPIVKSKIGENSVALGAAWMAKKSIGN